MTEANKDREIMIAHAAGSKNAEVFRVDGLNPRQILQRLEYSVSKVACDHLRELYTPNTLVTASDDELNVLKDSIRHELIQFNESPDQAKLLLTCSINDINQVARVFELSIERSTQVAKPASKKQSQAFAGRSPQTPKGSTVAAEFNAHAKKSEKDTYAYTVSLVGTKIITDLGKISGDVSPFFNGLVTGTVVSMIDKHLMLACLVRDTDKTDGVLEFAQRMRDFENIDVTIQGVGSVTVYDHRGDAHLYEINIGRKLVDKASPNLEGEL